MMEVTTYADRSQPLIECTAVQKHYPDFALDVTLAVPENTIVGLVGLNGSGKTTLFRLLTGLAKADDGSCRMLGQAADTLPVSVKEQIGVVLADTGFPAVFTPRDVKRVLAAFYTGFDPEYFDALVKRFAIPPDKALETFSTGMKARLRVIAAISHHPRILLLDEPTAGLDVVARNQILDLLRNIQRKLHTAMLLVSHDLGVVARAADRVAVMYSGKIVEIGAAEDSFCDPRHPYTWGLFQSLPAFASPDSPLYAIPGMPPSLIDPPPGDAFACRNPYALEIDYREEPPMFAVSPDHFAATWLLDPRAPSVTPPFRHD